MFAKTKEYDIIFWKKRKEEEEEEEYDIISLDREQLKWKDATMETLYSDSMA